MFGRGIHLDLDLGVVHVVVGDALAEALPRRFAGVVADQRVEQPLHRGFGCGFAHFFAPAILFQPHGVFHQVAGDLIDIAADIADLGELGRFDLDERRIGQLGQTARNLGLAAARGADHQDVLGRYLVAQFGRQALAAPAVAQRDGDRALGVLLADDMRIERGDDGLGGQAVCHVGSSVSEWGRGRVRPRRSALRW